MRFANRPNESGSRSLVTSFLLPRAKASRCEFAAHGDSSSGHVKPKEETGLIH
jgi:hypothetical protein